MTSDAPKCMECGSAIRKKTERKSWWITEWEKAPKTVEEARSKSNLPMVSHRWAPIPRGNGERFIVSASYWDGESYEDQYFCNGNCAKKFGYKAAGKIKERQKQ